MHWKTINFIAYSTAFLFYGSIITAMGPIIPFYAEKINEQETYFSFIFFCRAIGYVLGGSLCKKLMQIFRLHHILSGAVLLCGLSFMLSAISLNFLNQVITLTVGSACCCIINVISNVCVLKIFRDQHVDFWIQMLHTVFGVGGLLGPFVVSFFGANSYIFFGILLMFVSIIYFFIKCPQQGEQQRQSEHQKTINSTSQIIICILYLLYIGQQVGYGSWVSSFAVLEGVANPVQAVYASQIFWVTNTIFRLALMFITIKVSLRLKYLILGMMAGCTVNVIAIILGYNWFAAFAGSFLNGMFLASMFALFEALPLQFGFELSKKNMANFMMFASLGEGVLGMPIGYAMGLFGPGMLYWTQLIFSIGTFFLFRRLMNIFQNTQSQNTLLQKINSQQMKQYK